MGNFDTWLENLHTKNNHLYNQQNIICVYVTYIKNIIIQTKMRHHKTKHWKCYEIIDCQIKYFNILGHPTFFCFPIKLLLLNRIHTLKKTITAKKQRCRQTFLSDKIVLFKVIPGNVGKNGQVTKSNLHFAFDFAVFCSYGFFECMYYI